jgi:hypothetical protein
MSAKRESVDEPHTNKVVKKPRSLWWALAIALFLIVLPGLVMGPLFVPFVVIWALGALALSVRSKFAPVRSQRLRNLAVYLSAAVLVGAVHAYRIDIAHSRGQALVSAIQSFRAENRTYPGSLEELVPKYIDRVQTAAYGRFYYLNTAQAGPLFFYVTLPPFGRRGYCFEGTSCMGKIENPSAKEEWYDFD